MAVKSEIIFLRKYSHFPDFATGDHENDVAVCYLLKSVNVWLLFARRGWGDSAYCAYLESSLLLPPAADTSFAHFSDLTAALEHVVLQGKSKFFIQVACILSFFKIQQQKHWLSRFLPSQFCFFFNLFSTPNFVGLPFVPSFSHLPHPRAPAF